MDQVNAPSELDQKYDCARPECDRTFKIHSGRVPAVKQLYTKIRKTDVDTTKPLSRSEIANEGLCPVCCRLATFPTFSILATFGLMDRWATQNAERFEREREHRFAEEQRRQESLKAHVIMRLEHGSKEDYGFVNRMFAEAKPHREHHKKPGQRYMNANRPKREEKPKKNTSNKRH